MGGGGGSHSISLSHHVGAPCCRCHCVTYNDGALSRIVGVPHASSCCLPNYERDAHNIEICTATATTRKKDSVCASAVFCAVRPWPLCQPRTLGAVFAPLPGGNFSSNFIPPLEEGWLWFGGGSVFFLLVCIAAAAAPLPNLLLQLRLPPWSALWSCEVGCRS